jgi:hypothetical protein
MGFDVPVGAIADPAFDSELLGLIARPGSKEDALDPSIDAEVKSDLAHSPLEPDGFGAEPTG